MISHLTDIFFRFSRGSKRVKKVKFFRSELEDDLEATESNVDGLKEFGKEFKQVAWIPEQSLFPSMQETIHHSKLVKQLLRAVS